jgi:rare lipoprotein A (peptidoglycan hydrolase)
VKKILALALLLALGSQVASADPVGHRIRHARATQQDALATLDELRGGLARTSAELTAAERLLDDATVRLVNARTQERDAAIRLALARDVLVQRVRVAYEQGPATALDMLLSARNTGDLLSINEYTSHVMLSDMNAVSQVSDSRAQLDRVRQGIQMRQAALARQERQVQRLIGVLVARVQQAEQAAQQAGLHVRSLEAMARRLARARQREAQRAALLAAGPSALDEAKLLALLGPSGGRGCTIPSGLRDTGDSISGDTSWYGPDFAGGPTASGAIFDPSLFTAAHRTLPLGVFLRVHYRGRCAIVLVNDRGPYGNYRRIIDLARAPAGYLGLGVGRVTADILVAR